MRLVAQVRPPRGETVTAQGVGVQGHLLQRREGGQEVIGHKAELVVVEEKSPEGGQVTDGEGTKNKPKNMRTKTRTSSAAEITESHLKASGST